MLSVDSPLQLQDPRVGRRRELITGRVAESAAGILAGVFPALELDIAPDDELVVYYKDRRKYVQQAARAVFAVKTASGLRIEMTLVGKAVSAEGREAFRVTAIGADVTATLNDEADCPLLDVAPLGFAVNSREEYAIGTNVQVAIDWQGETYRGTVCVQSVRSVGRGRTRYGMRYLDDAKAAGTLRRGLEKISMEVQRRQLRNQSGNLG